ncbi:MAG: indole-3-glycerol phosphate synthase TrpC, partial [Fibrobacter sp.]|nr:indole-3-glycerol phosphate synthase TrpC [Fibrobacter sp.]
ELKKLPRSLDFPDFKPRQFLKALSSAPSLGIIAEIKKASPSKGVIRPDFDSLKIADSYCRGGANAISVLTDEHFFQGSLQYLKAVRESVPLPVLRKDFLIDILQIEQTARTGADALLLIAAALDDSQLRDLYDASVAFRIDPLIEVHTAWELERVLKLNPGLIGINNRNLNTFETDLNTTLSLIRQIPSSTLVVSESGIENGLQAKMMYDAGVKALLVGESLMRKSDPSGLIMELSLLKESK